MADRYVSSLAVGGGDGTLGDPWTLAEFGSSHSVGDIGLLIPDGVYTVSASQGTLQSAGNAPDTTVKGHGGTAIIRASADTFDVFTVPDYGYRVALANLEFQANGHTGVCALRCASGAILRDCVFDGVAVARAYYTEPFHADYCISKNQAGDGFYFAACFRCVAVTNGGMGFSSTSQTFTECIAANNTGAGFGDAGTDYSITTRRQRCIAYNNGGGGFEVTYWSKTLLNDSCIGWSNTGSDFLSGYARTMQRRCAYGVLGAGDWYLNENPVVLVASPFVDAAGGDFRLTDAAKTLLGYDLAFPGLPSSVSKIYPGAVNPAASGGSSVIVIED